MDSGSDDEYQAAGVTPPEELPQLGNMQLDPERERVRAWAASQIPDPSDPPTLPISAPYRGRPHAPPTAAAGAPQTSAQAKSGSDSDIQIDQERKAAILGAMKNIQLDYIPAWALRISENEFEKEVKAVVAKKGTER